MAINWNREVTGKDVKKFFNQEIKLGEINYSKCLQVSLLVFALGIVPAFTYGLVLGTLDEQRVALMGEVESMKAEIISAKILKSASSSTIIYGASTDKKVYAAGSTTIVYFYSALPASTTNIMSVDLYSENTLVQKIATLSPRQGLNEVSFKVASTSTTTSRAFKVRVTALQYNKAIETNTFTIVRGVKLEPLTITSLGKPSATVIPGYVSNGNDGGSDIGVYRFRVKITANEADRYVLTDKIASGFSMSVLGDTGPAKNHVNIYSRPANGDTEYGYKIEKGMSRYFDIVVISNSSNTVQKGFGIDAVNYANSAEGARTFKDVSNVAITTPIASDIIKLLGFRGFIEI